MEIEASNPRSSDHIGRQHVKRVDIEEEIHLLSPNRLGKAILLP
jgi:hypothetical protein